MKLPARIGKYVLLEFLGGGMTHVYRAQDTVLGRTVAIKILTEEGSRDPEAKARFLTEARLASGIQHENILSIYDFGEDESRRPYMVMEFLAGEDLRYAIRNGHTGDLAGKLKIAIQVARAIRHIHQQKIVHRDIKPENINVSPNGVVKVMDFGIAKTQGLSMTRVGVVLGTPHYMAPEQVLRQDVTEQIDVYAFGILLYELLTGTKPVQGETVERLFYAILNEPLNLDPVRKSGSPPRLWELVARCTAKNPAERPQGFDPVCAESEAIVADSEASTTAVPEATPLNLRMAPSPRPTVPAWLWRPPLSPFAFGCRAGFCQLWCWWLLAALCWRSGSRSARESSSRRLHRS